MTTTDVENFPGYPKGVSGPDMMDELREQAERFGSRVEYDIAKTAEAIKAIPELSDRLGERLYEGR